MIASKLFLKALVVTVLITLSVLAIAHAQVTLVSPSDGVIFDPCSMIASHQPSFNWTSAEAFKSYAIKFSTSSTDFKTPSLILSAQVPSTKLKWTPDITSWLNLMKKSYHSGTVRDIYWIVIGKKSDGTKIESTPWSFQVGPNQPVTIISSPDLTTQDSAIAPAFSFDSNCNVKFRLEFSRLADFSDPSKIVGFVSYVNNPNVKLVKNQTLSWDQWTSVKGLLKRGGYFRIKAWDAINRKTANVDLDVGSFDIYYFLEGPGDIYGTGTDTVIIEGEPPFIDNYDYYDLFTFYLPGWRFTTVDFTNGTWTELPNYQYIVSFPYDQIAADFEREMEQELCAQGLCTDVIVAVTNFYIGGGENRKADMINGTINLGLSVAVPAYAISGTASTYITFNGTRISGSNSLPPQETSSRKSPLAETLEGYFLELLLGH